MTGAAAGAVRVQPNPQMAINLLQLAGEFADDDLREAAWEACREAVEPQWDASRGELTYRLRLDEPHPRGQLNARLAAARACTRGAWSSIFERPNVKKFEEPTVAGVDFPDVVLTQARWHPGERALVLAALHRDPRLRDALTSLRIENIAGGAGSWVLADPRTGQRTGLVTEGAVAYAEVPADGTVVRLLRTG